MAEGHFHRSIERMINAWSDFFWDAFAALTLNRISGDYVEFGSLSGTTMWLAYEQMTGFASHGIPRHMWAFDSFQGLPASTDPRDAHPKFVPGGGGAGLEGFRASLEGHGVPIESYTAVEGFYEDTLPPLGEQGKPTDIALVYVDCNMYSSTVSVLQFLEPRLKHGMIVAFDDWFCWSETDVSGERLALEEFLTDHPEWRFTRFKEIFWGGLSFVVERAERSAPPLNLG